jgi:L-lactate dehydrogenase complex protein LldG
MDNRTNSNTARDAIFESIRFHLAASKPLDAKEDAIKHTAEPALMTASPPIVDTSSLVELFKENLIAVDGQCLVVPNEAAVIQALTNIIGQLRTSKLPARRIAISDGFDVERFVRLMGIDVDEVAITPSASEVFSFDIGITQAQAGIAETGTLLLDSSRERHRLVSLVPPIHIAILNASQIVATLGEALSMLRRDEPVSPIVTLVTGPSRTADIELTLAIGVHGPQELYVIVNEGL